jgi:hypothetical protein
MPGSNCETWRRICDDLCSNIIVLCWSCNTLNGQITASDYLDLLRNQAQPIVQILLPNNDAVFQDNNSPIHPARSVQSWFYKHEYALQLLPWRAQSPDLHNVKPLCTVLERSVRRRFPPASSLKQPEDVLQVEWCIIPLETIQNFYESIPRKIQAVLQAKVGPTPY